MYLDPASTFLWYSVVVFGLCAVLALVADQLEKAEERRERREERERLRRTRRVSSPARVPGQPTEGEGQSLA